MYIEPMQVIVTDQGHDFVGVVNELHIIDGVPCYLVWISDSLEVVEGGVQGIHAWVPCDECQPTH